MLILRRLGPLVVARTGAFQRACYSSESDEVIVIEPMSPTGKWKIREQFTKSHIQRDEQHSVKNYFAPDWELERKDERGRDVSPLLAYGTTPEKWNYYNKIVWNPNHVVAETGLPKAREVFHVRESIHLQPKKMWPVCQFVRGFNVDYAIEQLRFKQNKPCLTLADVLDEAKTRAKDEFHISNPSGMFVAEAFPIQHKMIKGARRHARENWLEEGEPRNLNKRVRQLDGWEKMEDYYKYLRSRDIKYSI